MASVYFFAVFKFCFVIILPVSVVGVRYGLPADTLHIAPRLLERKFSRLPRVVVATDPWHGEARRPAAAAESSAAAAFASHDGVKQHGKTVMRNKREVSPLASANGILKSVVNLNDSHYQMVIHWAGEGSDVIVALTRDISPNPLSSTSQVYISRDYGKTFQENRLMLDSTTPGIIDLYYNSPVYKSHYIFADVIHNSIWSTLDSGVTIQLHRLSFSPRLLTLHPSDWRTLLGFDERDIQRRLWLSYDFGSTWQVLRTGVKAFYWGIVPYDTGTTLYVQTMSPSAVLKYTGPMSNYTSLEIFAAAMDFGVIDRFMFATRNVSTSVPSSGAFSLQLWISLNRRPFQLTQFPNRDVHQDFFVADATEDQVFICANHNSTSTNLYISDAGGLRYSLSLENIVYFNPRGANKDSWLRFVMNHPFADVHKVEGLDGVYIATQMLSISDFSPFNDKNQISVISFNKGGYWHSIPAPDVDGRGNRNCSSRDVNPLGLSSNCSLHLTQKFQSLFPLSHVSPILSKKSAIGLIVATGNVGSAISNKYNIYMSNDGGLVWKEILEDAHFYAMGDHGGLVVAIRLSEITSDFLYSFDEGESWNTFIFSDVKIRVYGLLTEPGEKTTVFSIFGSSSNSSHRWIIVQVNLTSILGKPCQADDYKRWSPTDNPKVDCLLGRRTIYERRRPHSLCFNGRDYEREISTDKCLCTVQDYECDLGFRESFSPTITCVPDKESGISQSFPPFPCNEGSFYNRTKGYRRVVGDICEGGLAERYDPETFPCPIHGHEEFLLFTNHTNLHRYVFDHQRHEILQLSGLQNVLTVEYDYSNDCLIWSDARASNIQMVCLRDTNMTRKVIISENMDTIEGLAFNWMSRQIVWVDAGHKRIEVAKIDGTHRKILINSSLESPRAIVLSPQRGLMFWTDWSSTNPRISQSWLDGSNIKTIVSGMHQIHWPNGLAIDEDNSRLYFTDAYFDRISFCNLNGSGVQIIIQSHPLVQHPYSLGIFKDEIYWTDWARKAVLKANKLNGYGIQKVVENISGILDLKVLHRKSQQGRSACSNNNANCRSLCFEKPSLFGPTYTCRCSDMFTEQFNSGGVQCICADGKPLTSSGFCSVSGTNATCSGHQLTCSNGRCIPMLYRCDGDNDCGDGSDEINCPSSTCLTTQFPCKNGRCIPATWKCDHDNDCGDMSDEPVNCTYPSCSSDQFQCDNGRCIARRWVCDRDDDCHDGSDERSCNGTVHSRNCSALYEIRCISTGVCIPRTWKCDGDRDCPDGSDELPSICPNITTQSNCSSLEFKCIGGGGCIPLSFKCNGQFDCEQGNDERGCSTTTPAVVTGRPGVCFSGEFACASGNWCITFRQVCDGIQDCYDNSDERFCDSCKGPNHFLCRNGRCLSQFMRCDAHNDCGDNSDETSCDFVSTSSPDVCPSNFYSCEDEGCIVESWVCDGEEDCVNGDDEINCPTNSTFGCHSPYFSCLSTTGCIPKSFVCDGERDCLDGSDEECDNHTTGLSSLIPASVTCPPSSFTCESGDICVKWRFYCDGHWDCQDGSDERVCNEPGYRAFFVIRSENTTQDKVVIAVQQIKPSVPRNSTIELHCMLRDTDTVRIKSINVASFPVFVPFYNLSADTEYEVTVLTVVDNKTGPLPRGLNVKTLEAAPSSPRKVVAVIIELADDQLPIVNISWSRPERINGLLKWYKIYYSDASDKDAAEMQSPVISASVNSFTFTTTQLVLGHRYNIQVSASNGVESHLSPPVSLLFAPKSGCVGLLSGASGTPIDGEFVSLDAATAADGYGQSIVLSWFYAGSDVNDVLFYRIDIDATDILDSQTLSERTSDVRCTTVEHKPCWAQVNGLNPDTDYAIKVTAQGQGHTIRTCNVSQPYMIHTPGKRRNIPKISIDTGSNGAVYVNYTIDSDLELTDGVLRVFYQSLWGNSNLKDFDKATARVAYSRFFAKDSQFSQMVSIEELNACSYYCFEGQVQWPARSAFTSPVCLHTPDDPLAPVRDLLVKEQSHNERFVNVSLLWRPPCEAADLMYIVRVEEVGQFPAMFSFEDDGNNHIVTMMLYDLKRGATYKFDVQRDVKNARSVVPVQRTLSPYPSPADFKVISNHFGDLLFVFMLTWSRPMQIISNNITLTYDIFHSTDFEVKGKEATFVLFQSISDTKIMITDESLSPSEDHTFKVRIQSIFDYPGEFTRPETVYALPIDKIIGKHENKDGSMTSLSKENTLLVALLVPGSVVIFILVGLLAAYIVRHRRLQRSLLSYTSSHYNCRSNSATFNELDEEDQPMIQCFSDDEPLIVA